MSSAIRFVNWVRNSARRPAVRGAADGSTRFIANFATRINGIDKLAITKLDVLDTLPELKICIGYEYNGKIHKNFPVNLSDLEKCNPVYETHEGWQTSTQGIRKFDDLPDKAQAYLKRISELAESDITIISVGSDRMQSIKV